MANTFRRFAHEFSPTVLQGRAGSAYVGAMGLLWDIQADALRQALRAPYVNDGKVGPAYDAPELLGEGEYGITRYPNEAWEAYLARVQRGWTAAPTRGVNIVSELEAAGYPGAELRYHGDMPDLDAAD